MPGETISPGWRFAVPACLFVALVMYVLPWIEIRYVNPPAGRKPGENPPGREARQAPHTVFFVQSGFEAAKGEMSLGRELQELMRQIGAPPNQIDKDLGKALEVAPAPLTSAFGIVLIAGLVMGLVLPLGSGRLVLVLAAVVAALVLLGMQASEGFPLETKFAGQGPELSPQFTPFYYVAWGLTICSAAVVFVEWAAILAMRPRTPIYRTMANLDAESGLPPLIYDVRRDDEIERYDDPRWRNR